MFFLQPDSSTQESLQMCRSWCPSVLPVSPWLWWKGHMGCTQKSPCRLAVLTAIVFQVQKVINEEGCMFHKIRNATSFWFMARLIISAACLNVGVLVQELDELPQKSQRDFFRCFNHPPKPRKAWNDLAINVFTLNVRVLLYRDLITLPTKPKSASTVQCQASQESTDSTQELAALWPQGWQVSRTLHRQTD